MILVYSLHFFDENLYRDVEINLGILRNPDLRLCQMRPNVQLKNSRHEIW